MSKFNDKFWKWFGDSKVIDTDGKPMIVYHGSTHHFTKFTNKNCNIESHYGCGFYFSNSIEDIEDNYAGEGPDLTARIENLAEKIFQDKYDQYDYGSKEYKKYMEKARKEAAKELSGQRPNVTPCYLRIENPIVIQPKGGTIFEIEHEYDENGEDIIGESGTAPDLVEAIREVASNWDFDADEVIGDYLDSGNAHKIDQKLRNLLVDVQHPDTGEMASGEVIKQIYLAAGYDGIIQDAYAQFGKNMKLAPGTMHFIVFTPNQIKSAIGNDGSWDRDDDDIRSNPRRRR